MIQPTLTSGPHYANRKIGLLGGSFNPAHEGHLAISRHALKTLGLDEVWWLVSPQNPLKPLKDMAPFKERLGGARALTQRFPKIRVSSLETQLGTSYTVDTIESLQKRMPKTRFVWLMGMDNLHQIDRWRRWEDLFQRVPIAVFQRPGYARGCAGSKAVRRFAAAQQHASAARRLALMDPPVWMVLDNKHNPLSGTHLRQGHRQLSKHKEPPRGD